MQTRSKQQLEDRATQSAAPRPNAISKLPYLPSDLPPITVLPAKSRDKPLPSNHPQASVNMAAESQAKSHSSAALLQDPKNLENLEILLQYANEFKAFLKAKSIIPPPPIDVVESTNDHHSVTQPPPPPPPPPHQQHNLPQLHPLPNTHHNTFGLFVPHPPRQNSHPTPLHISHHTSPQGDMDGRTHEVFKQLQALLPKFTPAVQQWNMLEKNPLREDYQHMSFPKDFKLPAMD